MKGRVDKSMGIVTLMEEALDNIRWKDFFFWSASALLLFLERLGLAARAIRRRIFFFWSAPALLLTKRLVDMLLTKPLCYELNLQGRRGVTACQAPHDFVERLGLAHICARYV